MAGENILRKSERKLGLDFIGFKDGKYFLGLQYFMTHYNRFNHETEGRFNGLLKSILDECDDGGHLNPSENLKRKILKFKKEEIKKDSPSFNDHESDKDLIVNLFCYKPLDEEGGIQTDCDSRNVVYLNFKEFLRIKKSWKIVEKTTRIYESSID